MVIHNGKKMEDSLPHVTHFCITTPTVKLKMTIFVICDC